MTTESDFVAAATPDFLQWMESLGFSLSKKCVFWKKTPDGIFHVIELVVYGKSRVRTWAMVGTSAMFEGLSENGHPTSAATRIIALGGEVGDGEVGRCAGLFEVVEEKEKCIKYLKRLRPIIEKWVIPYFERLSTKAAVLAEFDLMNRSAQDENAEKWRRSLV